MTSAAEIQGLLRFLSQDAKLPMVKAMSTIKGLQGAKLTSPQLIASAKLDLLKPLFDDEKSAKQVWNAAKRAGKKRAAPDAPTTPIKKPRRSAFELDEAVVSPEASLALPEPCRDEDEIAQTVLITNRAPLVLAFGVVLLKYTMPEQPLSSRLSLAQAAVSVNSRSKAVSLGIEKGASAEEEGWGMGQAKVKVMGRDIRTMKRIGWTDESLVAVKNEYEDSKIAIHADVHALWALDLEALRKASEGVNDGTGVGLATNLPIYTPQSARSYLMRSFSTRADDDTNAKVQKSKTKGSIAQQTEKNVSLLLGALELLFSSWQTELDAAELDRQAWAWYIQVRPAVDDRISGWGAKGKLRLASILDLRKATAD